MDTKKLTLFYRFRDFIKIISKSHEIEIVPRTEQEKQILRKRIFWIVFSSISVSALLLWLIIYFNNLNKVMNNGFSDAEKIVYTISLSGSIIGAVIAGLISILATYFIVHQNYKMDFHKERLSHIPILQIKSYTKLNNTNNDIPKLVDGDSYKVFIEISNVGRGIALNVTTWIFEESWNEASFGIITYDSTKRFQISFDPDNNVYTLNFRFIDIFDNKYQQGFKLHCEDGIIKDINCTIPTLIQKTRRIRYIQ